MLPNGLFGNRSKKISLQSIDVCMIVYNEAQFIEACLLALKPYFKRLVVLDMESEDRTVDIIRSAFGSEAKILTQPRRELLDKGFAYARNKVSAAASSKWVLHVDADELLKPPKADYVAIDPSDFAGRAAKITRRNLIGSEPKIYAPEALAAYETSSIEHHVRLYKRQYSMRWESFLHEELWFENLRCVDVAPDCDLSFDHVSHFRDFAAKQAKEDFYAWILMRVYDNLDLQHLMREYYTTDFIPNNIDRFREMAKRFTEKCSR